MAAEPIGNGRALDDLDLGPILHEELAKLPEKYRAPMVLCYLDGQTCEEAADRLGWPVGTVKGRLSRAKDLLRQRLARRGVTASAAIVAATLAKAAEASVSPFLLDQTVKAAMVLAAGGALAATGLGSAAAVALAEGVNTTMILTKWKALALAATLVGTLAGSAAVMGRQYGGGGQGGVAQKAGAAKGQPNPGSGGGDSTKGEGAAVLTDTLQTTSLNEAMIAATALPDSKTPEIQLLAERAKIAIKNLISQIAFYENGTVTIDRVFLAAQRSMNARVEAAGDDHAAALKAVEDHVRLVQSMFNREKAKFEVGQSSQPNLTEAELNLAEAKILLAKARSGDKPAPAEKGHTLNDQPAGNQEGGGFGGFGGDAVPGREEANGGEPTKSDDPDADKRILAEFEKPISMPFASETPLEEVIKYIKTATTGPGLEQGIPVYVDPDGLQVAEKTMTSPIAINMEGIKLKTSLRLALKQLGLGYYVKHGLLIITNREDFDYLEATQPGWREARRNRAQAMMRMGGMGGMGGGGFPAAQAMPAGGGGAGPAPASRGGGNPPNPGAAPTPKGGGGFK